MDAITPVNKGNTILQHQQTATGIGPFGPSYTGQAVHGLKQMSLQSVIVGEIGSRLCTRIQVTPSALGKEGREAHGEAPVGFLLAYGQTGYMGLQVGFGRMGQYHSCSLRQGRRHLLHGTIGCEEEVAHRSLQTKRGQEMGITLLDEIVARDANQHTLIGSQLTGDLSLGSLVGSTRELEVGHLTFSREGFYKGSIGPLCAKVQYGNLAFVGREGEEVEVVG